MCKRTPRFGGAHGGHHRGIIEMPVNVLQMDASDAPDADTLATLERLLADCQASFVPAFGPTAEITPEATESP